MSGRTRLSEGLVAPCCWAAVATELMLPAHYYPKLKQYSHLKGGYGNAWWKQREEFEAFNGPILFTTNCIVPPTASATYKDRVFTTNSTGFSKLTG